MTWRSRTCRCASPSTAPAWSAPTARPMPAPSTSPYLGILPNIVVMAAADEAELVHMVATAAAYDEGPIAFRYPRGEGVGVDLPQEGKPLEIGKGRIVRQGDKVAILSLGTRLGEALEGRRHAGGAGHFGHGRRRALRQAARCRADPQPRPQARGADHHRGRLDRRLRLLRRPATGRGRPARRRPALPRHGPARRLPRPGQAGDDVRQGRPRRQGHRRQGFRGARPARRRVKTA